jgi:hypothetical protein
VLARAAKAKFSLKDKNVYHSCGVEADVMKAVPETSINNDVYIEGLFPK